jgi:hypothetical protein
VQGDTLLFDGLLFGGTSGTDNVTIQVSVQPLGNYSTVSGGRNNTSIGNCSTVGGGYCNTSIGLYSSVLGGSGNTVSNDCSFIIGDSIISDRSCSTFVNNLSIMNIPTSSAGLPAGSVYSDSCILKIV